MLINKQSLVNVFTGFNTHFNSGFAGAPSTYKNIAMTVPSTGSEEKYAWLGSQPVIREWIGGRIVTNLALHDFAIKNRLFESTITIPRTDYEDDKHGVFSPMFMEMGRAAAMHPDELCYQLLGSGFETLCYDGQPFFDEDHPSILFPESESQVQSVSNMQSGSSTPWYLIDASRAVKPLIFQERIPYKLTTLDKDEDENVFMQDQYLYGLRARANAGLGLWQLAFGSKADLTKANFEAAYTAMRGLKGEGGRPLGVRPTHLVVPTSLEGAGRRIVKSILATSEGETPVTVTNEWAGSVELLVSEYLPNS